MDSQVRRKDKANEEIGKKLSQLISETGLNQNEFSKKYKIPQSSLSAWVLGTNSLTLPKAHEIIQALRYAGVVCSLDSLFQKEIKRRTDHHQSLSKTLIRELIVREIAFHKSCDPHFTFLIVPDDALAPLFKRGDYVGGAALYGLEHSIFEEGAYIIETTNGFRAIRNLSYNPDRKIYTCSSLDKTFPSFSLNPEELILAARVTWHRLLS